MSSSWESKFAAWAQPPGATEVQRIENAITAIRKALDDDDKLKPLTKVYVQGSYRNRVNVREDSDVDLGILYLGNSFAPYYPSGTTKEQFGNVDADYRYSEFKDDVGKALTRRFGPAAVHRGDKAFDVHENTYRIDADVVPMFVHRRYSADGSYICGVQLRSDSGLQIVNWPERLFDDPHWPQQHYEHGVTKNTATGRMYKATVRILKKLRVLMEEDGIAAAKPVAPFVIECLVWNVPNSSFTSPTWDRMVQDILSYLWANTRSDDSCSEWGEVSELKYLFKASPGKRQQVHALIDQMWSYVGVG